MAGPSKGSSVTKITNSPDVTGSSVASAAQTAPQVKQITKNGQLNRAHESGRDGAKSSNSLNFSDLESTRIDFEDSATIVAHPVLESDNNSDIVIDEKKIVPESSKFKIVFISSESKSGSELNSSMEYAEAASPDHPDDTLRNVKGDFIDEVTIDQKTTMFCCFCYVCLNLNLKQHSDQLSIERLIGRTIGKTRRQIFQNIRIRKMLAPSLPSKTSYQSCRNTFKPLMLAPGPRVRGRTLHT